MMRLRAVLAVLLAATFCPTWVATAWAAPLVPPPGFRAAVGDDGDVRGCPQDATPYASTLDFPSKYEGSDSARDDLNEKADRRYKARTAAITALEKGVTRQIGDYVDSGNREALRCALTLLNTWSKARGLEGAATTHTGKSMRKWALGSVAGAYLRLKFSASQPMARNLQSAREIEAWIERLAERVVAEWRDQPIEKMNNHEYWAAWAVTASAVALNRRDLFEWAVAQYRVAASQIDAEGYLPNELKRETRALYYHNYAITPLAMIAAFGKANGVDLAAENDRALERLARRVLAGVEDPDAFEDKTGEEQIVPDFEERSRFAWLEPYCWTLACDVKTRDRLEALRPLSSTRLGGNLSVLFSSSADIRSALHQDEVEPWTPQIALR